VHIRQGTVAVDGAEIYYETRGEGPPILILQGGLSEASATEQLAEALARDYRVISYDRRGLSRSAVSTEDSPTTISRHAADAGAILAALSVQRARVIGPSIGALIGLELAVRHPELVATLVAHEPPMSTVVIDREHEAELDTVAALARADVRAAIKHLASLTGSGAASAEAGVRPAEPVGDLHANLRRFFEHDFPAVRGSTLDVGRIRAIPRSTVILPTGGAESRGQWEYRCAKRLARELDREIIEMPGGHNGFVSHPWATATELKRLFTESASHGTREP
jgi:pimeloyl-ACP methyl ester carboxylesterase